MRGVLYPLLGAQADGHHRIARVVKGAEPVAQGLSPSWASEVDSEGTNSELCILSSELFSTVRDPSPLTQLCQPGHTKIVIYVRGHERHLTSWYQQAVRTRRVTMELADFARMHRVRYETIVGAWGAVFGDENIIVRHYDRAALEGGDVVADFSTLITHQVAAWPALSLSHQEYNQSISGNLLFLVRVANLLVPPDRLRGLIDDISGYTGLDPAFTGPLHMPAATAQSIRVSSRADKSWLLKHHGIQLADSETGSLVGAMSPDRSRLLADLDLIARHAHSQFHLVDDLIGALQPLIRDGAGETPMLDMG